MNTILTQHELKDFSCWCADHLSVDFTDVGDWAVMSFGSENVINAYTKGGEVKDYLFADTETSRKCYDLYLTWRDYNA